MGGECKVYQNISNPATYAQVLIAEPLNEVHGSKRWSRGVSNTLNLISQHPSNHRVCVCSAQVFRLGVCSGGAGGCANLQSSTCDVKRLTYDKERLPEKSQLFLQNTFKAVILKIPPESPSSVSHRCITGVHSLLAEETRCQICVGVFR